MNKFLGILFFYTITFYDKRSKYENNIYELSYIQEKSRKYLDVEITGTEWETLKELLKDYPEPMERIVYENRDFLDSNNIEGMIDIFDEVIGLDKIDYTLRMYGVSEEVEKEQLGLVFGDFQKFAEIIGTSNGISHILCEWLSNTHFDKKMIERHLNFKILDVK